MIASSVAFYFYLFGGLALIAAILVILNSNPIYSALFLILVFLNAALIILLLDVEFLALIFVLIYIGAIMVLFLFIIMMLDIKFSWMYLNMSYYFTLSGSLLLIVASEFLYFLSGDFLPFFIATPSSYLNWYSLTLELSTIHLLGTYLYTEGSFFTLLAGVILLVAMVGSISLTLEPTTVVTPSVRQSLTLRVKPTDSFFYLKSTF